VQGMAVYQLLDFQKARLNGGYVTCYTHLTKVTNWYMYFQASSLGRRNRNKPSETFKLPKTYYPCPP
jgi:hypothetical protein